MLYVYKLFYHIHVLLVYVRYIPKWLYFAVSTQS